MNEEVRSSADKLRDADITLKKLDEDTGMVVSLSEEDGLTHIFPFESKGLRAEDVDGMISRMERARRREKTRMKLGLCEKAGLIFLAVAVIAAFIALAVSMPAHAEEAKSQKYQVEVGVTPTVTKAVDDTLSTLAAQIPGAEKLIREAGSKASGVIVLFYAQSVRKHFIMGFVFLFVGVMLLAGAYLFYHPHRGDRYTYINSGAVAGTIVCALAAIPFLSWALMFLASPQYYAMKDTVHMLAQVLGKVPGL